ncbi:hypothetical protein PoB_003739100 [Plakobranchus ocellatus]|uniref:Uncharacterized protein n=1 Tax=Plakobranchus ocellatus TaxID=259542 RepID=A0AAV4AI84_9GAST|nr:hypothetical protein PoB_003739100 [Plakobranchus ocellatus]
MTSVRKGQENKLSGARVFQRSKSVSVPPLRIVLGSVGGKEDSIPAQIPAATLLYRIRAPLPAPPLSDGGPGSLRSSSR